jgi:hypothetical protein
MSANPEVVVKKALVANPEVDSDYQVTIPDELIRPLEPGETMWDRDVLDRAENMIDSLANLHQIAQFAPTIDNSKNDFSLSSMSTFEKSVDLLGVKQLQRAELLARIERAKDQTEREQLLAEINQVQEAISALENKFLKSIIFLASLSFSDEDLNEMLEGYLDNALTLQKLYYKYGLGVTTS